MERQLSGRHTEEAALKRRMKLTSSRIASKIGLFIEENMSTLSTREIEVRKMTLRACFAFDGYFTVFGGPHSGLNHFASEIRSSGLVSSSS
jgi:hypothetical protein